MKGIIRKSTASKKKLAAIFLSALMLVNIFSAAVEKNPTVVSLSYDGLEYAYDTYASTVEEFLIEENIPVKDNDYISHDMAAPIEEGMRIVISVAKYVTVRDGDATYGSITHKTTVGEVMSEFSAPLGAADSSIPAINERVYDGIVIEVTRAKLVTFSRDGSTLKYYTHSNTVGEFLSEMGVTIEDDERVVPEVDSLVTNGMTVAVKEKVEAMSPLDFGIDLSNARVITCEATAYTAAADECWPYADGLTATGVKCQVGVVAVDPKVIPLKSKLYIETADGSFIYGYCTAEDTGGAIKGNKIDLAMNTKADCFQFGRRQVKVYILS